ncbi:hypothetical protein EYF80_038299 [Liparis tanakae]|uniref:Uncharacterized protein n=1 Tax=Liparis tanakae TaxID=230148 RepID=A0A4Z2GD61_9TELE|nr:hypothetical protein EYF80_038299 [Liparis tanakae]
MLTNPPWQTSCNSPLKSATAVITGTKASTAISFWILSSSCSAWLTAAFSWAFISSLTSKRFSSMERISSVKTASLSAAAVRADRWRETQSTGEIG